MSVLGDQPTSSTTDPSHRVSLLSAHIAGHDAALLLRRAMNPYERAAEPVNVRRPTPAPRRTVKRLAHLGIFGAHCYSTKPASLGSQREMLG